MHFAKAITGTLALAACAALVPNASAQTLKVLTAGSSAQFGDFAVAAYSLAKVGGAQAFHYTVKSGNCLSGSTSCYASIADSRTVSGQTIPNEPGNLWVVWSSNGIWAYLSVDSTVGVRAFQAVPRAALALSSQASLPLSPTTNYTFWADNTADSALTTTVFNALNNTKLTAANTDIRPEDALYATNRSLNILGYGSVADPRSGHSGQFLIGNSIKSTFGTGVANPVSFAIAGNDPFSGQAVPSSITLPIGAAPIVFLASTVSGSGTAKATNITTANAASLFSGSGDCHSNLITGVTSGTWLSPVLREPLSGTMNTVDYSVFVPGGHSQETNIHPSSGDNPLNKACGGGFRYRAVGTGDEVKDVQTHANTVGYAFFSYESVGGGGATPFTYRYIKYNGVDPIKATYTDGTLPNCSTASGAYNCPKAGGTSFPNLRNGTYTAWSIYRLVTDSAGQANAAKLVAKAVSTVNGQIPDFVPFSPTCTTSPNGTNDPGLAVYREHYIPSGIQSIPNSISITANDGQAGPSVTCTVKRATLPALTLGGGPEAGGDVGGTIQGPFTSTPPTPGPIQTTTH